MLYDLLLGLHLLAVQTHTVYLHLAYLIITGVSTEGAHGRVEGGADVAVGHHAVGVQIAEVVQALLGVYRDATGDRSAPKCIGGGTYAKVLPNTVAFGPLFDGDPVTEHQPDEFIDLDRLVQNAQIIAQAVVKLANLPLE